MTVAAGDEVPLLGNASDKLEHVLRERECVCQLLTIAFYYGSTVAVIDY